MVRNTAKLVNRCYYCGRPADSIDHVIPRKLLGMLQSLNDEVVTKLIKENRTLKVFACRECNSALGSRYDESLLTRKRRAREFIKHKYAKFLLLPDWTPEEIDTLEWSLRQTVLMGLRVKQLTLARLGRQVGVGRTRLLRNVKSAETSLYKKPPGKNIVNPIVNLPPFEKERKPRVSCNYTNCGKVFEPKRSWQRFCSTRCRWEQWNTDHPRVNQRGSND